jgi:hypothetical protein
MLPTIYEYMDQLRKEDEAMDARIEEVCETVSAFLRCAKTIRDLPEVKR